MAIYVDPSSPTNGVGTEVDPKNAPGNMSGNTYLFKRGTTYRPTGGGNAIPITGNNVVTGFYGSGDYPCIIDCLEMNRGINVGTNLANVNIGDESFKIWRVGAGANRRGFTNATTGSSGTTVTSITIGAIEIDTVASDGSTDCNGVNIFGAGNIIDGLKVTNVGDDGIWFRGNLKIRDASIKRVARSGRLQGDCVQGSSAVAGDCAGWEVFRCLLDHSDVAEKQCFILNGSGGNPGLFMGNSVYGHDDALHTTVYIDDDYARVIGNYVVGGNASIAFVGATRTGSVAYGNVVRNEFGKGITLTQDNLVAAFNTVVGGGQSAEGIRHNDVGATSVSVLNNIVVGFSTGISMVAGCTEDYNCVFDCETSISGGAAAHSILFDPILSPDLRLHEDSPCRSAGLYIPGARHHGGKRLRSTPDIGAFRYYETLEVA